MELTQLHYFTVVARLEHFRKAAQELHVTQPTLSQSIARLEEELDCPLFDRVGRNAYLNSFGREFEKYVRSALMQLNDGKQSIQALKKGNSGDVRIGTTVSEMITPFLRPYLLENPGVHIHQVHGTAMQLKELLENREIDFAILIVPLETVEISWELVAEEELGLLVSAKHWLADRKSVVLEELRDERFIVNNANQDISNSFLSCFTKAGVEPNIIFEGDQTDLIGELVEQNRGITVCSEKRYRYHCSHGNDRGNRYIRIDDLGYARTTGFSRLRNRPLSPAASAFYEYLRSSFRTGPGKLVDSAGQNAAL